MRDNGTKETGNKDVYVDGKRLLLQQQQQQQYEALLCVCVCNQGIWHPHLSVKRSDIPIGSVSEMIAIKLHTHTRTLGWIVIPLESPIDSLDHSRK